MVGSIKFLNEDKEVIAMSGTNLRLKAIESDVDIYKGMTKLLNCWGNGKCGNCIVEVLAGEENLSPRTPVEEQKLNQEKARELSLSLPDSGKWKCGCEDETVVISATYTVLCAKTKQISNPQQLLTQ